VLWCGVEQALPSEENGVCRHNNTPMFKSVCERGGLCVKTRWMKVYLERDAKSRLYSLGDR